MAKKIIAAVLVAALLVCLYFGAYKLTVKIRTPKSNNPATVAQSSDFTSQPSLTATETEETESETEAPETEAVSSDETTEEGAEEETTLFDDSTLPEPAIINMPTDEDWPCVLINKFYKMNSTYEPQVAPALEGSSMYLDIRVAEKFAEMYSAAIDDGVTLTLASAYVSLDRQDRKFQKQVTALMTQGLSEQAAEAQAAFTVMPSGCSESNYGLAVDIGWMDETFADSPAYEWLSKNAESFGFVERYTAGKSDYTHFHAEPWHWRYVGPDAAAAMNSQNLCLEEYLGKVN